MTKPSIAAIIIGIDGWQEYTLPLIKSIQKHEPECNIVVVDNESKERYPVFADLDIGMTRTPRLCYSAAINLGKSVVDMDCDGFDWYIVLSNDVLCTGPFAHILEELSCPMCTESPNSDLVGPQLWHEHGLSWIVGWCVAIPRRIWDTVGGWDEQYIMSSWEDVDFSHSARKAGFSLEEAPLPFVHLDQRQRFGLPGYGGSEQHNWAYFNRKHEVRHAVN